MRMVLAICLLVLSSCGGDGSAAPDARADAVGNLDAPALDGNQADAPPTDGPAIDAAVADASAADAPTVCTTTDHCPGAVCCITGVGGGTCVASEADCGAGMLALCDDGNDCVVTHACCPQGFCASAGCD